MSKGNNFISIDHNGELIYPGLNSHVNKKYRADTALDKSFVPYLIMVFCAIADSSVFINLFKLISYDSPFMLVIQVCGCLFAFDVIPLYIGIQLKRIMQGLSKERFIIWLALIVCILACIMNVVLRIMTIDQMLPDISSEITNYFETAVQESENIGVDSTAIALTIFGIILPILTSIGSFFVSYLCYNPLQVRKRMAEEMMTEKKDEIRRLEAILSEYDADTEFAEHLIQEDEGKFEEMKKMQRALVVSYCDYVRQRLKEHLANPSAINALSEETCITILERLDRELIALDKVEISKVYVNSGTKEKIIDSNEDVD